MAERNQGRRGAAVAPRRRFSPLSLLAALIPLLTIGALAIVRPAEVPEPDVAPSQAPLARSTVVCPAEVAGARRVDLASAEASSGALATRVADRDGTAELTDG